MKKNKSPDECPICGQFMNVICSGYHHKPFADGRCYEFICQGCYEVPCTRRFVEDCWMLVKYEYGKELHTLEEMMSFGWEKQEAQICIKAVKKVIKFHKK
jgi:hypothetical protein